MRKTTRTGLEALTRARPDALDPARLGGSQRQHDDLVTLLSTEPSRSKSTGPAKPWSTRRRLVVPLVGAAAVAVVAAGAVVSTTGHAPVHTSVAAGSTDGHLVLLTMANSVQNQATQGSYWEQQTQTGNLNYVENGANPYVISETQQQHWSIGVRPGEQSLLVTGIGDLSGPRTTVDTKRWQAAGSPSQVEVNVSKTLQGKALLLDPVGAGHETVMRTDYGGDIVALGPNNVNYAYLQQLPSDQAGLAKLLDSLYTQENGKQATVSPSWMFEQVGNLITFPVSNAVRAAAYRILADLPGITSLGKVTDPLGRTGIGVALAPLPYGDLGLEQQQLIVDPTTNTILSQQEVLLQPSKAAIQAGLASGALLNYTATTHIGWTDKQIATPTTASTPTPTSTH